MDLTPDEKQRIYFEEKARQGRNRAEAEIATAQAAIVTRQKHAKAEAERLESNGRLKRWAPLIIGLLILWIGAIPYLGSVSQPPAINTHAPASVPTVSASSGASNKEAYVVAEVWNSGNTPSFIPKIFPTFRACQYWIKEKGGPDIVKLGTHLGVYMCVPHAPK